MGGGAKGTKLMERSAYKNPDIRIENTKQGRLGNKIAINVKS